MKNIKRTTVILKRVVLFFILFISLIFVAPLFMHNWLEQNLIKIINKEENRAYDVSFATFDLNFFFTGFKLEDVSIMPINKKEGTIITCKIDKLMIGGFSWENFLLKRQVDFTEMSFLKPVFEIIIGSEDVKEETTSKQMQQFFGDILSRVKLNNFKLIDGSFILYKSDKKLMKLGHIGKFNIVAKDIETDSIQWKYPIPFKLREFSSSVKDIFFVVDEYSSLACAEMTYKPKKSKIELKNLSLKLNKHWTHVSDLIGKQVDIMEFDLKSLTINGIETNSQLYGDYDIRSKYIEIDGLVLKDYKNKNKPFYNKHKQAMFSGLVAKIPIGLKVDKVIIKNTFIIYTEMPNGRNTFGTIHLDDLKGSITHLTTLDSLQKEYGKFEIDLIGKINNEGKLSLSLSIPYTEDKFHLKAKLEDYEMTKLNRTIEPMLGVMVESGHLLMLDFDMKADRVRSKNVLKMKYTNLVLNILNENKEVRKKRGLITGVANSMIKDQNLPGEKHYREANYKTVRNQYRAPFNFIWLALQDGIPEVILTDFAKELLKSNERHNKKRERKAKKQKR